jgi:hypothetical protein
MGDDTIQSTESFQKLLEKYEGQNVLIRLNRDGKSVEKQVQMLAITQKAAQ